MRSISAFFVPYSPYGRRGSDSRVGAARVGPCTQIVPHINSRSTSPVSPATSADADSGSKQTMSITTSGRVASTASTKLPSRSAAARSISMPLDGVPRRIGAVELLATAAHRGDRVSGADE